MPDNAVNFWWKGMLNPHTTRATLHIAPRLDPFFWAPMGTDLFNIACYVVTQQYSQR